MALPTNRTVDSTTEDHVNDHNTIHAQLNELYPNAVRIADGRLSDKRIPQDGSVGDQQVSAISQNKISGLEAKLLDLTATLNGLEIAAGGDLSGLVSNDAFQNERTARIAAEATKANSSALTAEANARIAADQGLQTAITGKADAASLTTEVSRATTAEATKSNRFTDRGSKTAAFPGIASWDSVKFDCTAGAITTPFPTSAVAGDSIRTMNTTAPGGNALTVGTFVVNAGHTQEFLYTGSAWERSVGHKSDASLDARYSRKIVLNLKTDFGAIGDNVADDTAALAAFAAAVSASAGVRGYMPTGIYRTTARVDFTGQAPHLFADGPTKTFIKRTTAGSVATFGPLDGSHVGGGSTADIRDFALQGLTANPSDFSVAFQIAGLTMVNVQNIVTYNTRVGFDLINNCFGATFTNCYSDPATTAMPVVLRGASDPTANAGGSGNDTTFINCRWQGRDGGVAMSSNGGGYRFLSGLISAVGSTVDQPTLSALNTGYDYFAQDTTVGGSSGITCIGVSFEQMKRTHAVRATGGAQIQLYGCSFVANTNTAISVLNLDNGFSGKIVLDGSNVQGQYSAATPITVTSKQSGAVIYERATTILGGQTTFAGVAPLTYSLCEASGSVLSNQYIAESYDNTNPYINMGGNKVYASPMVQPATNLVKNPSFQNGTPLAGTGAAGNTTLSSSSTVSLFGSNSAVMTATAAGNIGLQINSNTTDMFPISAGTTYSFSAFTLPATVARTGRVGVDWYTSAAGYISTSTGATISQSATSWTRFTLNGVLAPAGAAYGRIVVNVFSAGASEQHYVDGLQAEANAVSTPFLDGSFGAGYAWTGAANNSSSTRTAAIYAVPNLDVIGGALTTATLSVSNNANLNGLTKATKSIVSDDATKGVVLKDAAATPHYWRVTVSTAGVLTTTDLGTSTPTS